jgi:hypothetical protein
MNRLEALAMAQSLLSKPVFSKEDAARARGYIELAESLDGSDKLLYGARARIAGDRPVPDVGDVDRAAFRNWLLTGQVSDRLRERELERLRQQRDMGSTGGAYPGSPNGYFAPVDFMRSVKSMMKQVDRLLDPDVPTSLLNGTNARCLGTLSTPARWRSSITLRLAANGWRCWHSLRKTA